MKYYAREWPYGYVVSAKTGDDMINVLRFDSQADRKTYIENYDPPSHSPSAWVEIAKRNEIESYLPRENTWGDQIGHWIYDDNRECEIAV